MIGRLKGQVVAESPDGILVVDVRGVGYEVAAPLGTRGRAPIDAEGNVTLLVHTHVREDAIVLFGFSDDRERTAFRTLTGVAGVGPKIAVAILGSLPAAELASAVAHGDVKRLQGVSGVGKKIAERLCLELKDKLALGVGNAGASPAPAFVPPSGAGTSRMGGRLDGVLGQLVDALVRLGFKPAEAERAAVDLKDRTTEPLDALLRDALRSLTA